MKYWLGLVMAIGMLHPTPLTAQKRAADSLRTLLQSTSRPDTLRVRRLHALGSILMVDGSPQSIVLLKQALALSRQLADYVGEGRVLITLGTALRRQAGYPEARRYTQQAQALFTRRANRAGLGMADLQLALIEMDQGNPAAALQAALQGIPNAEHAGDLMTRNQLQLTLGSIYVQMGNYKEALPVLRTSLRNGKALGDNYVMAAALNQLGKVHQLLKNWPQAVAYFERSLRLNRRLGDDQSVIIDETSLAELYVEQGDFRRALRHGLQARASSLAEKNAYNLPPAELALARAYLVTEVLDSAIALGQHALALSQRARSNEDLRNATDILAQAYARRGDYVRAYLYQSQWVAYKDSISGEETQRKTSAMRYGYELDRKQNQITLLTRTRQLGAQKAARQRLALQALLAGLLGTVLVAGLLARNIYLKQRTNRALNDKNAHIAQQRDDLNRTLFELRATQNQLVQSEKMVALAALTAGVAHEIQNPLNFVNNFSEVSMELVAELEEEEQKTIRDTVLEAGLLCDLKQNLRKIHQHGSRAGDIVKGMLQHARVDTGQRQPIALNALVQDYLRLAYQSQQGRPHAPTVAHFLQLAPDLEPLDLVPQEIGRVLLNLFANAFYAVEQKAALLGPAYQPEVRVRTRRRNRHVELRVRDNGTGIPMAALPKIFEPFFTTKPPGDGTGLGLWLSYDIITKGYGGTITVQTEEGEFTEFTVTLPLGAGPPEPM